MAAYSERSMTAVLTIIAIMSSEQIAPASVDIESITPKYDSIGAKEITNELIAEFADKFGIEPHVLLRRKIFNSHFGFDEAIQHSKSGKPVYVYIPLSPTDRLTTLRHVVFFQFAQFLQQSLNCYVFFHLIDTKAFNRDENSVKWNIVEKWVDETIKDILSIGFDPAKTIILPNSKSTELNYVMLCDMQRKVSLGRFFNAFFKDDGVNVGLLDNVFQAAAAAIPSYCEKLFPDVPNTRCLCLLRHSQKPLFDLANELADIVSQPKPYAIFGGFVPPLQIGQKNSFGGLTDSEHIFSYEILKECLKHKSGPKYGSESLKSLQRILNHEKNLQIKSSNSNRDLDGKIIDAISNPGSRLVNQAVVERLIRVWESVQWLGLPENLKKTICNCFSRILDQDGNEIIPSDSSLGNCKELCSNSGLTIYLKNTPKEIQSKLNKSAFSGGKDNLHEQREFGANLSVDIPMYYFRVFLKDDQEYSHLIKYYGPGDLPEGNDHRLASGDIKKKCGELIGSIVSDYQKKRQTILPQHIEMTKQLRSLF